jgi:hypothetical protein
MSVNERPVYNSANLAMFMVNVSQALMRPMRAQWAAFSVNEDRSQCLSDRSSISSRDHH